MKITGAYYLFRRPPSAARPSSTGAACGPEDGTIDDIPLLMRIATSWDLAYLNLPLAVVTAHSDASSSSLGSFTPNGFRASRSLPEMLYDRRRQFLDEADLPDAEADDSPGSPRRRIGARCSAASRCGRGPETVS